MNEKYTLYSDTLEYNTQTKIADIVGPSTIVSDSNIIYSSAGWYNTETDKSMLLDRSLVTSKGQSLTGDTIFTIGDRDSAKCSVIWCSTTPFVR